MPRYAKPGIIFLIAAVQVFLIFKLSTKNIIVFLFQGSTQRGSSTHARAVSQASLAYVQRPTHLGVLVLGTIQKYVRRVNRIVRDSLRLALKDMFRFSKKHVAYIFVVI